MTKRNSQILGDLVSECTAKVFEAYGAKLQPAVIDDAGHEVVAVIGYAADEVRGGLALGITKNLVRATMPTPNTPIYDWAGELANQVLGRVRNRLLSYRLDIQISTPVVKADARHAALPILMLTTEGAPDLIRRAKAAGVKGWIVKPFKADQVVAAITKLTAA